MNSLPIVALIGMAVLVTATVGFGNTLATSPDFNFIAASDNNAVTAARVNVTELVWTEEVGLHGEIETDLITFTVGNEDGISGHAFNICAVIQFDNVTGTFFFCDTSYCKANQKSTKLSIRIRCRQSIWTMQSRPKNIFKD
jgi:hypothetical protein